MDDHGKDIERLMGLSDEALYAELNHMVPDAIMSGAFHRHCVTWLLVLGEATGAALAVLSVGVGAWGLAAWIHGG